MPWFPDFVSAAELARSEAREAGRADPVSRYFEALIEGESSALQDAWPGDVVIHDPRAGEVRGHKQLREFVTSNHTWLAARHARTERIAATCNGGRAVVELLAQLDDGETIWPLAVVAEFPDDRSVVFRTYCSQWPAFGQRQVRGRVLAATDLPLGGVVERHQLALRTGDTELAVQTFEPDGWLREPTDPPAPYRGADELRGYFARSFGTGGIDLERGAVTDDGVRCALEFTCVRWGSDDLAPQAGLAVYERGRHGLLAAVRRYDDIEPPV